MAYCVNPYCQVPGNSIASGSSPDARCHSCQTPLLLHKRYTLLGPPLCDRNSTSDSSNALVFEVQDNRDPKTPKVLKVLLDNKDPLPRLFAQEQQLLMDLEHEGIPKGYDIFDFETPYGQLLPCLVMEKIIGQNLQQRRLLLGPIAADTALNWLKQLTEILNHIHQQDFFHRDIKPSNIMQRSGNSRLVLIDFGTARRMTETIVVGNPSTVVLSYNYTAPEQLNGQAEKRSDFYALGKTILHLMTDLPQSSDVEDSPPMNQKNFAARSQVKLSPAFEKLLFDLIHPSPNQRPSDTLALLKRIQDIENLSIRRKSKNMALIFVGGMICGSTIMIPLMKKIDWHQIKQSIFPSPPNPPILGCDKKIGDYISCGEEMLLKGINGNSPPEAKNEGIKAFLEGDYEEAKKKLKTAFDQEKDPETLIYLNNSKINTDPKLINRKVTIAAIVPLGNRGNSGARDRAAAILRGVAQAQTNALEQLNLGLQIVIADDDNKPEFAKPLSYEIVARRDVLGGIGHASSDALVEALPQYEASRFVFIAPASTAEELSSAALGEKHIFFRSLPSNRVNANYMVALLDRKFDRGKIAIYYNPDSAYSLSLATELRSTYMIHDGAVLVDDKEILRIDNPDFDPKKALNYARQQGARIHILIPDAAVKSFSPRNSLALVKENNGQDWIIAGDSLAGVAGYLNDGDDGVAAYALGKMIFSAAWDPSADLKSPLLSYWDYPKQSRSLVDWRSYTSYNATWMMATAATQGPNGTVVQTREQLRLALSDKDFQAIGIGSGDPSQHKLSFQEKSGEIANPKIYLSIVAKCDDRYTTVLYKNPVCPDGKPAFPNSKSDVAK